MINANALSAQERVAKIIRRIRRVYLLFAVVVGLGLCLTVVLDEGPVPRASLERALSLVGLIALYAGLRLRKRWVVHLVLISSTYGVLTSLLGAMEDAYTGKLVSGVISCLLLLFWWYQMWFFNRRDVRGHFREPGLTVF